MKKLITVLTASFLLAGCAAGAASIDSPGENHTQETEEGSVFKEETPDTTAVESEGKKKAVLKAYDGCVMTADIPESWKTWIIRQTGESESSSVAFSPMGHTHPVLMDYLELLRQSSFGVCGTGLETKDDSIDGKDVSFGYYDGNKIPDFVSFKEPYRGFEFLRYSVDEWDKADRDRIDEIIRSIKVYKPEEVTAEYADYGTDLHVNVKIEGAEPIRYELVIDDGSDTVAVIQGYGGKYVSYGEVVFDVSGSDITVNTADCDISQLNITVKAIGFEESIGDEGIPTVGNTVFDESGTLNLTLTCQNGTARIPE